MFSGRCLLISFLLTSAFDLGLGAEILGDRVLVEVDRVAFTQRQLESYMLVRSILDGGDAKSFGAIISPISWVTTVDDYVNDTIVHLEAERVGSFQPAPRSLATATEVLDGRMREDGEWRVHQQRLGISQAEMKALILRALRVAALKRSQGDELKVEELRARSHVRYFADALRHKAIAVPKADAP